MLEQALTELKEINNITNDPGLDEASQEKIIHAQRQKLKIIRDLLNQSFKDGYQWEYSDYYLAETLEMEQLPSFYENRVNQLKDWLYNEEERGYERFSEQEKQYLISCYESLDTPFEVGYTTGWDMAYEASASVAIWGSIILAFLMSGIFAGEFRWKTDSVYFSTEHGRKKGSVAKLGGGFAVTTILYWGIMIAIYLFVLSYLGFDGAFCPVQASFNWWNSIYRVTFMERALLGLMDGYICWLFISSLVLLISAISRSLTISVIVPSLLMLIPRFLEGISISDTLSKILRLLPHRMLTTYGNESIVLYSLFDKVTTPITIQRILYPCMIVLLGLLCYRVNQRKQIA